MVSVLLHYFVILSGYGKNIIMVVVFDKIFISRSVTLALKF